MITQHRFDDADVWTIGEGAIPVLFCRGGYIGSPGGAIDQVRLDWLELVADRGNMNFVTSNLREDDDFIGDLSRQHMVNVANEFLVDGPLVVAGQSRGGSQAVFAALDLPSVRGIFMMSTPLDYADNTLWGPEDEELFADFTNEDLDNRSPINRLDTFTTPMISLQLHGELDTRVPMRHISAYYGIPEDPGVYQPISGMNTVRLRVLEDESHNIDPLLAGTNLSRLANFLA